MAGLVERIIWEARVAIHVGWDHDARCGRCLDLRGEFGRAFSRLKGGMSVYCTLRSIFAEVQHLPLFHLCSSSSLVAVHSRILYCATSPPKDEKVQKAGTEGVWPVPAGASSA